VRSPPLATLRNLRVLSAKIVFSRESRGHGISVMGWTAPATASMCHDEGVVVGDTSTGGAVHGRDDHCVVGRGACGNAHHWARRIGALGHEVRLLPPAHVKRGRKNDAADAPAARRCGGRRCGSFR
jgi:transposase